MSSARNAVAHCARPPKQFKDHYKDANAFPDTVRGEPVEPWTVSASAVHPSTGSGRTAFVSTGTAPQALSLKQRISSIETQVVVDVMRRARRETANAALSTREHREHDHHYDLLNHNAQRLQREKKGRDH